jgi:hypothetical protein
MLTHNFKRMQFLSLMVIFPVVPYLRRKSPKHITYIVNKIIPYLKKALKCCMQHRFWIITIGNACNLIMLLAKQKMGAERVKY